MARSHLSIGEVLSRLHDEFPDVTISKIRFLETQGLIDPERTASGYRKFYEDDVELLRWVLVQQRDSFLPLRVIRDRIAAGDHLHPEPEPEPDDEPVPSGPSGAVGESAAFDDTFTGGELDGQAASLDTGPSTLALTIEELASAAELSVDQIASLETYGLVQSRPLGPSRYYDAESLAVARVAAGFMNFGVEPRHLRMYKTAAEREADVFEQVVMPLLRQRTPSGRRDATEQLEELAGLGARLRAAMMRQALLGHNSSS
ncbi:MAG: MerR family transcriptional regulator [Actinomycetia bacterium]|nr:MerR family transcriptional regulator [Actinomycetes bacterium]MCP4962675.1 MerR family transcriptional regulator [Actinomycetes bacterium]